MLAYVPTRVGIAVVHVGTPPHPKVHGLMESTSASLDAAVQSINANLHNIEVSASMWLFFRKKGETLLLLCVFAVVTGGGGELLRI
jgi:hypothetical protein